MGINGYCSILLCGRVSSPSLPTLWRKAHSAMHSYPGLRAVHSEKSQGQRVYVYEDIQTITLYLGGTTQIFSQHVFKTFTRDFIPLQGSNAKSACVPILEKSAAALEETIRAIDLSCLNKYASMTPRSFLDPQKVNID